MSIDFLALTASTALVETSNLPAALTALYGAQCTSRTVRPHVLLNKVCISISDMRGSTAVTYLSFMTYSE